MSENSPSYESRLEQLAREVRLLSARVDELTQRLASTPAPFTVPTTSVSADDEALARRDGQAEWTGATVLAGTAAVCFLLVIALTLRTLVDASIIDQPIGAVAGLIYAALILIYGYYRARSKGRFASLSITCGAVLVLAIVLETHFRFKLLSTEAAYGILAGTLSIMLVAGLRYRAYGPLSIALPGIALVAMSLDFPDPSFLNLSGVMILGVIAAYAVTANPRTRWLVWCMLVLSVFFWIWWTIKLRVPLLRHDPVNASLWQPYFLPVLAAFVLLYLSQTLAGALNASRRCGVFECAVPSVAAVGAYCCARATLLAEGGTVSTLGQAGAATAVLYVALAEWLARRGGDGRRAATWFGVASMLLIAASLPDMIIQIHLLLVVWCVMAAAIATFGNVRRGPVIQFAAILLQVYACLWGVWRGAFNASTESPALAVTALACLCLVCAYHHVTVRRVAAREMGLNPASQNGLKAVAIVVFWVSVVYAFGASRIVLFQGLTRVVSDPAFAFECGQSVLINVGALLLALLALRRMRHDLLVTAIMVAGFGALKVFMHDLLTTQGIALVIDVFVFGVTTTAGSLIWNRWQRAALPDGTGTEAGSVQ